jgi:chromosome segregation ATPase
MPTVQAKALRCSLRLVNAHLQVQFLTLVTFQLDGAKADALHQSELVQNLHTQIKTLEGDLLTTKERLNTLQATSDAAFSAAKKATVTEEELLKANADLKAMGEETQTLKAVYTDLGIKLKEFEEKEALSETMKAELVALKTEKEQSASKLSELEVEILELKDNQEAGEDERGKLLTRLKSLEGELAEAISATERSIEDAKVKDEEYARQSADAKKLHEDALKTASDEQAKVIADLEALRMDLSVAQAAHERAKAEANSAMEELTNKLNEAELLHLKKQNNLSEEVKKLTAEVEVHKCLCFSAFKDLILSAESRGQIRF